MWVAAAVMSAALAAGCAELDGEGELATTDQAVAAWNRVASNRVASNRIASNALGSAVLSSAGLATSELMVTEGGREVLGVIIECALPGGAAIGVTYAGAAYTFPGQLGLAPGWATSLPTATDRRWVTACLLSRTNLYGVPVAISMRHDTNPALAIAPGEHGQFNRIEGAFYGDLFGAAPALYACANRKWTRSSLGETPKRACALSEDGVTTECGFTYTGECSHGNKGACTDKSAPYRGCNGGGTSYQEVITIALSHHDQQ